MDSPRRNLPVSPETLRGARAFVYRKWVERSAEPAYAGGGIPADLSGSCKFSALFAQALFGGEIRANPDHTFVRLDGEIIDLNADAKDVKALERPYSHWRGFARSQDFRASLASCQPRVERWVKEFFEHLAS